MSRFRKRRVLLQVGVAAPVFAFASVGLAAVTYPGFNNARQYLSELGSVGAPHPVIFNAGVVVSGLGAIAGGLGFSLALVTLGGSRLASAFITLCFALAGIGMVIASYYPWPDPRHLAINLGLGIQLAPLFLLWGLRRIEGMGRLRWFLVGVFIAMAILTVLTKHLVFKGLVNDANVGWWERAFAVVLVGWTGIAAYALERQLVAKAGNLTSG